MDIRQSAKARTADGRLDKIVMTNGDGAVGNPTIDINEANLMLGNIGGTLGAASGGSATSITFTLPNTGYVIRQTIWTVSATAGGITRYWRVELTNEGLA